MRVLLAWVGVLLFVAGGVVSVAGGPLLLAVAGMVLGALVLLVLLFGSVGRWRPTEGRDPAAKQAEARLWSTLNNNRR